jgi:hypothetical protein
MRELYRGFRTARPSRAYSYAISSQEVLIAGNIPPEAINWVEDVSSWMLFP